MPQHQQEVELMGMRLETHEYKRDEIKPDAQDMLRKEIY
jgi:hypothetical protein